MDKSDVIVTVSGPVGSGKSAICGEIEIALKAIGVPVVWDDRGEKNATHADWQWALEMYRPSVRIVEKLRREAPKSAYGPGPDYVPPSQSVLRKIWCRIVHPDPGVTEDIKTGKWYCKRCGQQVRMRHS